MARFGLFILNKGKWKEKVVLHDEDYFESMINTSQDINPSYGYSWWLNGKSDIVYPGFPAKFKLRLSNHAPDDLVAGMSKNGQFVEVIPSLNMVVIRMGEEPSNSLVPFKFHDEMWERVNQVIGK